MMKELTNAIVSNIPCTYHSSDLRNFFSEFVELGNFHCFHYRHRPEIRYPKNEAVDSPTLVLNSNKTGCCVICLPSCKLKEFVGKYSGKHWLDKEGTTLPLKCFISKVKVAPDVSDERGNYQTREKAKQIPLDRVQFSQSHLQSLAELNPPSIMPNGNVGTPTTYFLELIRTCRMPSRMIGKLGLCFPKMRGKGRYSSVPYHYGGQSVPEDQVNCEAASQAYSGTGKLLTDHYIPPASTEADEEKETETESDEDDDTCEEWERHTSLHEDVTEQERTKERLYEEEIELKWEKGGSGLVFYTDAQHWDSLKGDFDERTADDWDVDMSVYYDRGGGDRDAKEMAQMRLDKRRRKGMPESAFKRKVGCFERHTKGIGRRLLERHGWSEGQGLGRDVQGIAEALENEGQHPKDKRGFGYHGEKLSRVPNKKPPRHLISTIYDKPSTVEIVDPD